MQFSDAINRFVMYLRAERNLAPRTVEAYRYEMERLRDAFSVQKPPIMRADKVETWHLKTYLADLKDDHECGPATLSRTISALRSFFKYLAEQGLLQADPALPLRNPKKPKKLPIYLTQSEAGDLLAVPDRGDGEGLRDYTILLTLTMTGIRLAELVGLDVGDLDFSRRTLKVFGKGRRERLAPMNGKLETALQRWLAERPRAQDDCPALFLSRKGDRISRRTVQYLVRRATRKRGLDPRISPHKLRHTFATSLYAEAVGLRDIQDLLGHRNIASTSVYTHTNVDRVRKAVDKLRLD